MFILRKSDQKSETYEVQFAHFQTTLQNHQALTTLEQTEIKKKVSGNPTQIFVGT